MIDMNYQTFLPWTRASPPNLKKTFQTQHLLINCCKLCWFQKHLFWSLLIPLSCCWFPLTSLFSAATARILYFRSDDIQTKQASSVVLSIKARERERDETAEQKQNKMKQQQRARYVVFNIFQHNFHCKITKRRKNDYFFFSLSSPIHKRARRRAEKIWKK